MTLNEIIRADFDEFIRLDPSVPQALKDSLRLKERIPGFIDKLTAEIKGVERAGIILDRIKIKGLVYNLTGLFVHLLKTQATEMEMSDIAKSRAIENIEGSEIIKKFDDQGNADLSDEMGIIITDKG